MLYYILKLCRERGSNPHAPFGARDFKRIFSFGLSHLHIISDLGLDALACN